jgi:peptide deformylase
LQSIKIVPATEIPKGEFVPLDNPIEVFKLITQMEKICVENQGIGLSAVQVGIPWNLFIIRLGNKFEYYPNCDYEGHGEKIKSIEGCLSLRDRHNNFRRFEVDRFEKITVRGQQLLVTMETPSIKYKLIDKELNGDLAIVYQHEIDHAKQILISDIGKEIEIF